MCRIEFFSRLAGNGAFIVAGKSPAFVGKDARTLTVVFESYMNAAALAAINTAMVDGVTFRAELESLLVNGKFALFRVTPIDSDDPQPGL